MSEQQPDSDREYFYFRPDWRAEIPFGLLALKVAALLGLPIWLGVLYWRSLGNWLTALFIWALLGAGAAEQAIRQAVEYRRKIREGRIILDEKTARLPLPGKGWRHAEWEDVAAVRLIRAGGLLGEGILRVHTRGHRITIPGYVVERERLIEELLRRAGFDSVQKTWWATTWRRRKPRREAQTP